MVGSAMIRVSAVLVLATFCLLVKPSSSYENPPELLQESDVEALSPITEDEPMQLEWLDKMIPEAKRTPLSINQAMVPLSNLVNGASSRRRIAQARNFLSSIGKRGLSLDQGRFLELLNAATREEAREDLDRNRRGMLSVDMPLGTLSSMLQAERRRQFHNRARNAHTALASLGKRSVRSLDSESL